MWACVGRTSFPSVETEQGKTPPYFDFLLRHCDANVRNSWGGTPLYMAIEYGNAAKVAALLPYCDELTIKNGSKTALMLAVEKNDAAMVALLAPLCDTGAQDDLGDTALMLAFKSLSLKLFDILIPYGDGMAKNKAGRTALMMAANTFCYQEVIEALLPISDVEAVDEDGKSALDYARANPYFQDMASLIEAYATARREKRELSDTPALVAAAPSRSGRANRL
jgi:ankyrin repeat protein